MLSAVRITCLTWDGISCSDGASREGAGAWITCHNTEPVLGEEVGYEGEKGLAVRTKDKSCQRLWSGLTFSRGESKKEDTEVERRLGC